MISGAAPHRAARAQDPRPPRDASHAGGSYCPPHVSRPVPVRKSRRLARALALLLVFIGLPLASGGGLQESNAKSLTHDSEPEVREVPSGQDTIPESARTRAKDGVGASNAGESAVREFKTQVGGDSKSAGSSECPPDMVLVQGEYCTDVQHVCTRWLDDEKLPFARCAQYAAPAKCIGRRVSLRYCIDRHEYTAPGEALPKNQASFVTSSKICQELDRRVCTESEWNFACEGEEMKPYPYGWAREPKCNQDQADLYVRTPKKVLLKDLRSPRGAHPECVSPFGVHDLVGNLDEPVLREAARNNYPFRNALKGGWWMSGRNRCRPSTTAHDDHYQDVQVGVRCCRDVPDAPPAPTR
jgi:hypothetical protein